MERRLPSPEAGGPIGKWEVKAIADAVEAWYRQGADADQKNAPIDRRPKPKHPPEQRVPSVSPVNREHEQPIHQEDVTAIVSAAEHFLSNDVEADRLEDKIRVLRIEEAIIQFAPDVADELRQDAVPHWVAAEQYRLLPHDAPAFSQRRWALWAYEDLRSQLQQARESGDPFTAADVLACYVRYQQRELPESMTGCMELWEQQGQPIDFTLENLFAIAQRKLLLGYRLRDRSEHLHGLYQDTLDLHRLIEQVVAPDAVGDVESPE
jgi:hypothetical protein